MKKILFFLTALTLMLSAMRLPAQNSPQKGTIDKLRSEMAHAKSPKDSVKILYDIFDLSPSKDWKLVCTELYNVARRAGDVSSQLDICRHVSIIVRDDKSLDRIEAEVKRMPASDEKKETELFLKMRRTSINARHLPEEKRQKYITYIIDRYDNGKKKTNKYQRVINLFTLVEYLRNDASGDMLKEYIDRLVNLANSSQFKLLAIPNMVYSEAANIYSDTGDHKKAVAADKKLLEVIDDLEESYADQGREYRNYNRNRYIAFRRMLRNYEALEPAEVQQIYGECERLATLNQDIKIDMDTKPAIHAHYNMALGNYAAAIPYLKQMIDGEPPLALKRQTLEMLVLAADKTGDDKTKLFALSEYNDILEELSRLHASQKYSELLIKYDLMDLKERNTALEIQNRDEVIESSKQIMTFLVLVFIMISGILVFSLYNWTRYKHNTLNMGNIVDNFTAERNRIRRSLRLDNTDTKENSTDKYWQKRFKESHRKKFEMSTFMTESIINDMLCISMLGRNDRLKNINETSVSNILQSVMTQSVRKSDRNVRITVSEPDNDFSINTDSECLTDVLVHIVEQACQCTTGKRNIDISCEKVRRERVNFYITSTERLPELHNMPHIFNPLVSIKNLNEGTKDGLYVCRMIAMLLTCNLRKDISYADGTRLIFNTPDNLENIG